LDIRESFTHLSGMEVKMRNAGIQKDIADYISNQLAKDPRLKRWLPYRAKIEETLVKGAQGV
jgi:hypothetical protein